MRVQNFRILLCGLLMAPTCLVAEPKYGDVVSHAATLRTSNVSEVRLLTDKLEFYDENSRNNMSIALENLANNSNRWRVIYFDITKFKRPLQKGDSAVLSQDDLEKYRRGEYRVPVDSISLSFFDDVRIHIDRIEDKTTYSRMKIMRGKVIPAWSYRGLVGGATRRPGKNYDISISIVEPSSVQISRFVYRGNVYQVVPLHYGESKGPKPHMVVETALSNFRIEGNGNDVLTGESPPVDHEQVVRNLEKHLNSEATNWMTKEQKHYVLTSERKSRGLPEEGENK